MGIEVKQKLSGRINFVDLAGAEKRKSLTTNVPEELKMLEEESVSINLALMNLRTCIRAQFEAMHGRKLNQHKKVHIPVRNSELTRVMADTLKQTDDMATL